MALNLTARFTQWSFNTKSKFFMLVFSAGIIAIGILAGRVILDLTAKFTTAVEEARFNLDAATTARVSTVEMQHALYHLVTAGTSADVRVAAVSAIKSASFLDESLQNLSKILPDNEKVKALSRLNETVKPIRMEVIENGMHNNMQIALNKLNQLTPMATEIDMLSQTIFIDEEKRLIAAARDNANYGRQTIWLLGGIIIVILAATSAVVISNLKLQTNRQRYIDELKQTNKKLEDAKFQLLQAEKMASIGQLAAGVAHEINNPIGFVSSNLNTLEKYINDIFIILSTYERIESSLDKQQLSTFSEQLTNQQRDDLTFLKEDIPSLLRESRDGLIRVKKIVENLKGFSQVDTSNELQYANIEEGLESTLAIAKRELESKVTIVKEYSGLPNIQCFPSELNQVFLNMLINAAHAIKERGTITIRTGKKDEKVWVEISDSGDGISRENLDKIFDPFFTTKPIGKGTGLGLSLSYGIIKKHNGTINVESTVGLGTTFKIWLPI